MRLMVWIVLVPVVVIVATGLALSLRYPAAAAPATETSSNSLITRTLAAYGRIGGALAALAAGAGFLLAVMWPIGFAARKFDHQDHRFYGWVQHHDHVHDLTRAMKTLTKMGNNTESQVLVAVGAVVLGALWFYRRRNASALIPAVVLVGAYELEHQLQHALNLLAHRGHPPGSLGTFPSGGCARLIMVGGLIIYLLLRVFAAQRTKLAVGLWTLLALAAWIEAFARVYLSQHWLSDTVGGVIFGVLLLGVLIPIVMLLDSPTDAGQSMAARTASASSGRQMTRSGSSTSAEL